MCKCLLDQLNVTGIFIKEKISGLSFQICKFLGDLPLLQIKENFAVPGTVPHCAARDTQLGGYYIPENTVIMPLFLNAHLDPSHWPEPLQYKPERWLEGGKLLKTDHFLPFGIGV